MTAPALRPRMLHLHSMDTSPLTVRIDLDAR